MKRIVALLFIAFCFVDVVQANNPYQPIKFTTTSVSHPLHCSCAISGSITQEAVKTTPEVKEWSFFVYMAARNDLHPFSKMNMRQMLDVGSNERINIVVQLDEPIRKGTQRFYVEKGNPIVVHQDSTHVDSGNPDSLIEFCRWAVAHYPAKHYAIVLWDHGTGGSTDPHLSRYFETQDAFDLGIPCNWLAGQKQLLFPSFLLHQEIFPNKKGVCFDELYRSYINNQGLARAFDTIDQEVMHGKKWDIVGFDACLMADLATAAILRDYANIMVGSQEVEPGTGWNYRLILSPFVEKTLEPTDFATHIVRSYAQAYFIFTQDFTQSAVDLRFIEGLEQNIHDVAQLLVECLRLEKERSVLYTMLISCHPKECVCFDDPSYKDLGHLYSNVLTHLNNFRFTDEGKGQILVAALQQKLSEGLELIQKAVLANAVGKNVGKAMGISIYYPERHIHSSFPKTTFAAGNERKNRPGNAWYTYIKNYHASLSA